MSAALSFPETNFIEPQPRNRMRVVSTNVSLHPDWESKIEQYALARANKAKERIIQTPFLFTSFYDFLGRIPGEVKDIKVQVKKQNAAKALDEIDDLVDKAIEWRMKLSNQFSIE